MRLSYRKGEEYNTLISWWFECTRHTEDEKGLFSIWNVLKHLVFANVHTQLAVQQKLRLLQHSSDQLSLQYMKWLGDAPWNAFIFSAFTTTLTLLWINPLRRRFWPLRRSTGNSRWWWFEWLGNFCFHKDFAALYHLLDRLVLLGQRT